MPRRKGQSVIASDGTKVPHLYRLGPHKYQHQFRGNFSNDTLFAGDDEAIRWAKDRTAACNRKANPTLLLKHVLTSYLHTFSRGTTRRNYRNAAGTLLEAFPFTPLDKITEDELEQLFRAMKPATPGANVKEFRKRRLALMDGLYEHVIERDERKDLTNHCRKGARVADAARVLKSAKPVRQRSVGAYVRPTKAEKKKKEENPPPPKKHFSAFEMRQVVKACMELPAKYNPERRTLQVLMAYAFGLRISELIGFEVAEFNRDEMMILLRGRVAGGEAADGRKVVDKDLVKTDKPRDDDDGLEDEDRMFLFPPSLLPAWDAWMAVRPDNPRWLFPRTTPVPRTDPGDPRNCELGATASERIRDTVLKPLGLYRARRVMHALRHTRATLGAQYLRRSQFEKSEAWLEQTRADIGHLISSTTKGIYIHEDQTDIDLESKVQVRVAEVLLHHSLGGGTSGTPPGGVPPLLN